MDLKGNKSGSGLEFEDVYPSERDITRKLPPSLLGY